MSDESTKDSVRNISKFYFLGILAALLFVAGAIVSGLVIKEQPQVLGLSAQSEITSLISQIGKLIVLPSNELPTATTINNLKKLKGQSFFRKAKKGDKLLVYTNKKWAVLYRPSENRIIEVGTFDINKSVKTSPTVSPTLAPSPVPPTEIPTPTTDPALTPTISPTTSPDLSPTR